MPGWWSRLWRRLLGRSPRPGTPIPAPATLVDRVESAGDHDRAILKLAEESLRRGFPDQAEIAYEKAGAFYQRTGHHRKAVAVWRALSRLRADDPQVFEKLAGGLEDLERRADAARALRTAAERHRQTGAEARARAAVVRARELELRALDARPATARPPSADGPPADATPVDTLDMPDEEVNSLVLEALSREALEAHSSSEPAAASGDPLPSMPGASVFEPGPIELPGLLDDEEPSASSDRAFAAGSGETTVRGLAAVTDGGLDSGLETDRRRTDPFEDETPVETEPPRVPRAPPIPADPTVREPGGPAAMRSDPDRSLGPTRSTPAPIPQAPAPDGTTRVAPARDVARLLDAIRKKPR